MLQDKPFPLRFQGLGNFRNKVVFARLVGNNNVRRFNDVVNVVKSCYEEYGIDIEDGMKTTPHLTLFKLSKDPTLWERGVNIIDPSLYRRCKDVYFGSQIIEGLQLLSMLEHKDRNGYYFCEKEILFGPQFKKKGGAQIFKRYTKKDEDSEPRC